MSMNNYPFSNGRKNATEQDVFEEKKALRAYMKKRRGENENRDVKNELLAKNVQSYLSALDGAGTKRKLFVYLSYSSEAGTDKLIETLLKNGHTVYCPRIENGQMEAVAYGEDFSLSNYGIREPIGCVYNGDLDIVITPLLAVDTDGNRLGYGGGYYDAFFKKHPEAERVGYCYDFQIIKQVPHNEQDVRLQKIITDKRYIQI